MALAWKDILTDISGPGNSLVQALRLRGEGFPEIGARIRGHESLLAGWAGAARASADAVFAQNHAYAAAAGGAAAQLASALGRVVDGRAQLLRLASNIVEDGAQLRFTFSDTGEINDFYGSSGLWSELPADDKARYLRLRDELPRRVADLIAQGRRLDDEATRALTDAAGLAAPPAMGSGRDETRRQGDGLAFTRDQGMAVFQTGDGDDVVSVQQASGGRLVVTVNGRSQTLSAQDSQDVLIQTQGGDDRVTVDPDVAVRVRFQLGDGDDVIDDQAVGGSYIDAGKGDDTVTLGQGHNTVYLGSGNNTATGSKGVDSINGGSGNNTINAGSGNSVLYGGSGRSTINAGTGRNTVYAGTGDATINNQGGQDTIYAQAGTHVNAGAGTNHTVTIQPLEVPDSITVQGSPEFLRRMQDDLELLAASPDGQHMLSGLGSSGHRLLIDDGHLLNNGKVLYNNGYTAPAVGDQPTNSSDFYYDMDRHRPGPGTDAIISIDTTLTNLGALAQGPKPDYHELNPAVVLYHEMAHAYDDTHGAMMPGEYGPSGADPVDSQNIGGWSPQYLANAEHEAVGLPLDWDGDPKTPEVMTPDSVHPHDLTENALRDEMGLPDRKHYLG